MGSVLLQHEQSVQTASKVLKRSSARNMGNLQIVQVQKPGFQAFGVKSKISNCASLFGRVKHAENMHYLHDLKDVEEALAKPKAHWPDLEDRKARLWGLDTRLQGQSTLDECMEKYKRGSAKRKRCIANLARLCVVENLPLHIGIRTGFVNFMRKWEPQWPRILKQSVTR